MKRFDSESFISSPPHTHTHIHTHTRALTHRENDGAESSWLEPTTSRPPFRFCFSFLRDDAFDTFQDVATVDLRDLVRKDEKRKKFDHHGDDGRPSRRSQRPWEDLHGRVGQ